MPIHRMFLKSIDTKRLLHYGKNPPKELDITANIRVMDVKPIEKGRSHIMIDIVYSMRGHKEETPIMDTRLEIDAIYEDKEEKLTKMYERWKKNQEIEEDVYHIVGNNAFAFSVITLMPLTERMRLPPVIPIPRPIPPAKKKD